MIRKSIKIRYIFIPSFSKISQPDLAIPCQCIVILNHQPNPYGISSILFLFNRFSPAWEQIFYTSFCSEKLESQTILEVGQRKVDHFGRMCENLLEFCCGIYAPVLILIEPYDNISISGWKMSFLNKPEFLFRKDNIGCSFCITFAIGIIWKNYMHCINSARGLLRLLGHTRTKNQLSWC